jgi:hypothetical protein
MEGIEISKIYLETTMFSFYYAKNKPEYQVLQGQVRQIFGLIKAGKYEPYTSILATDEIDNETNREKRENMWRLIADYNIRILPETDESKRLTALYIQSKAVPEGYPTDAGHIAITALNGLDFIISLNFEHIARPWTIERVRRVNKQEGFDPIGIYRPVEVLAL